MDHTTVSSSQLRDDQRWDAAWHCLLAHGNNRAVYEELLAKLDLEELTTLALKLPFDLAAARVVMPSRVHPPGHSDFVKWLEGRPTRPLDEKTQHIMRMEGKPVPPLRAASRRKALAAYCAVAGYCTVSKVLLEMEAISKKKLEMLRNLTALLKSAEEKTPLFRAHLRGPKDKNEAAETKE